MPAIPGFCETSLPKRVADSTAVGVQYVYGDSLTRPLSARFKIITIATVLCLGAGVSWMLLARFQDQRITDRALLREAVAEWQRLGAPDGEISREIFEQQAMQGYYDDAAGTGLLFERPDGVRWSVVALARIRAENGDLQGAKAMLKRFAGSDLGAQIAKAVALTQVSKGDLQGALELAAAGADREEILLAIAGHQIENGDFAAALETAARMKSPNQVFYELGSALQEHSQQKRVRQLASGMNDRKLAAEFAKLVRVTLWPPAPELVIQATPCEIAADYGLQGRFAEADALIEQNKCTFVSFVAIRQYAVDPAGAERLLRSGPNADDFLFGLDQLAVAAAKKSNIAEALRFLGDLQNLRNKTAIQPRIIKGTFESAVWK